MSLILNNHVHERLEYSNVLRCSVAFFSVESVKGTNCFYIFVRIVYKVDGMYRWWIVWCNVADVFFDSEF
jgi:hypothetical protein